MKTDYKGIDYSLGRTNIDHTTGIRYGVIPVSQFNEFFDDMFEAEYGDPTCPKCGNTVNEKSLHKDYYCDQCHCNDLDGIDQESQEYTDLYNDTIKGNCYYSDQCFGDQPIGWTGTDSNYEYSADSDCIDAFITKSPYYTHAQFCSPCAPGACYLLNPCADGPKAYCFGHDCFPSGKAPYPVFNVTDDKEVLPNEKS
jgi:ribosomal protein L37AE/L43A